MTEVLHDYSRLKELFDLGFRKITLHPLQLCLIFDDIEIVGFLPSSIIWNTIILKPRLTVVGDIFVFGGRSEILSAKSDFGVSFKAFIEGVYRCLNFKDTHFQFEIEDLGEDLILRIKRF